MNGYEKIIDLMRKEGATKNPETPKLAEMISEDECSLGDLTLDSDDLLVADHLKGKLEEGDTVLIQRIDDETYVIIERVVEP